LRRRPVDRLCARDAYVYREHRTRSCLKSSSRENRLAKLTGTAPLTSCRLEALRIALISGVAWSCLAGWAGSADAAARGMGAPYGWYDGWYAPQPAMPARKARVAPKTTNTKKEKAEPKKKDVGFGQMSKGPLQIVVSIGNQKVTLFSNGVRVAQGPISTGVPGHPTPTGVFSIIEKDRYHHSNLYSNAPMPYMQRITWSGVALHEGVLPGYPASHGCIRMSHDFAQKLWPITNLGVRVIVAHHELAPVDFAHPKLFAPKLQPSEPAVASGGGTDGRNVVGTIVMAQAPVAEPGSAASDAAAPAQAKPGSDATSDRESEMTTPPAQTMGQDADVVAGEAQPAQATDGEPTEASGAGDAPEVPQTSEPAAPVPIVPAVGEPRPTEVAPSGSDAAKPAPTVDPAKPVAPPTKAADQPTKRSGQVAVFVSRKEQKIFVRQGFVPLFEMPIVIEQPDQPLGTHVFTAMEVTDNGGGMRWNLISVPAEAAASTEQRDTRKKSKEAPAPAVRAKPPASAAQALDRIEIPQEAADRISEILIPGSSLVVSDEGLGRETGRYTEFIVLSR
jgi:lipoprotein-anchoring transpeptidase ErfK/SrfK